MNLSTRAISKISHRLFEKIGVQNRAMSSMKEIDYG